MQFLGESYIHATITKNDLASIENLRGTFLCRSETPHGQWFVAVDTNNRVVGQIALECKNAEAGVGELRRFAVLPGIIFTFVKKILVI